MIRTAWRSFLVVIAACFATATARPQATAQSLQQLIEQRHPGAQAVVKAYPDSARETIRQLFRHAVTASTQAARQSVVTSAQQLAALHASIWNDPFLPQLVARFDSWPHSVQAAKVSVDSLRVAGAFALSRTGSQDALRLWRESSRLAHAIHDTAGLGAAIGNIGIAFLTIGNADSARFYLQKSIALAERIGDRRTALNAQGALASLELSNGNLATAQAMFLHASAVRVVIGDDRGLASDDNNLGLIAAELGDTAHARERFRAALTRNMRAGRAGVAADNVLNLANLEVTAGRYAAADSLYRTALNMRRATGEYAKEALILHDIGLLQLRRADFAAAQSTLDSAIQIFEATGQSDAALLARLDAAQASAAAGEVQHATELLAHAANDARLARRKDLQAHVALETADLVAELNARTEARMQYALAESLFRELGDIEAAADARQGLALLLFDADPAEAHRIFTEVMQMRQPAHDRQAIAHAQLLIGAASASMGDAAAARSTLGDARSELLRLGDIAGAAAASVALGNMELAKGDPKAALRAFNAVRADATLHATGFSADTYVGRARAYLAMSRVNEARADLLAAIHGIESQAARIKSTRLRGAFRSNKWNPYVELALLEQRNGGTPAAFAASERLRSREMLELLNGGRISSGAPERIADREQDARHRLAALAEAARAHLPFFSSRSSLRDAHAQHELSALATGQREYSTILDLAVAADSAYANLLRPPAVAWHDVAAHLATNEAFVEYLVSDSTTVAFVVRGERIVGVDLALPRATLAASIDYTREMMTQSSASQRSWERPLQRLHRLLVEPLESTGALLGATSLIIAPHSELHYLPFAALRSNEAAPRYLVERYDVAYVPSATVWLQLRNRSTQPPANTLVAFAPRPDALPASRREVSAVAQLHRGPSTLFIGKSATKEALRRAGAQAGVLHLATFGVLNRQNPLYSYVEFAGRNSAHQRLAVHELFGGEFRAHLVVLSACRTGLASGAESDVPPGDEWVGLVRAFLYAGAQNVLATLWAVDDRSSELFMRLFYEELQKHAPGTALARAQRRMIYRESGMGPMHWAAYSLSGAIR